MATGSFCCRWTNIAPFCFCCKSSLWAAVGSLLSLLGEEWTQSWFTFIIISAWKPSWEVGVVIWILASKGKNLSQIFSAATTLDSRLLNYNVRKKAALPFQQFLTEAAGAVFCMKPCVLTVIWASFLGQTSEEKEHLVWDVCRCAVMTKLFLSNKTQAAWGNKKHEFIIQENFIGLFRVGMPDILRITFLEQTVPTTKKLYGF